VCSTDHATDARLLQGAPTSTWERSCGFRVRPVGSGRDRKPRADVFALLEEFARLRDGLPEDLRPVFDMRLEGYTNAEIAARLGRVERTVELKLQAIRGLLGPHLGMGPPATAEAKPKQAP
jgi:DNA-directed RNA polymerase specialized sigma24 family protein